MGKVHRDRIRNYSRQFIEPACGRMQIKIQLRWETLCVRATYTAILYKTIKFCHKWKVAINRDNSPRRSVIAAIWSKSALSDRRSDLRKL